MRIGGDGMACGTASAWRVVFVIVLVYAIMLALASMFVIGRDDAMINIMPSRFAGRAFMVHVAAVRWHADALRCSFCV